MAVNSTLSPTIIAREALRLLKNNLVMGNLVYRAYEKEFPGNPKKGGTVTIRKPVKFLVTKSRVRVSSVITENSITLTVSTQAHVSWAFESVQLALTIEEYSDRYIRPAAAVLANTVDADLCALYKDIYNTVWESTTFTFNPHTFMVLGKAMQKLDEEAAPPDERVIVLNPAGHWSMANALSNWNFASGGEGALRKGLVGRVANADVYMDQNIKAHTSGCLPTESSTVLGVTTAGTATTVGVAAGGPITGIYMWRFGGAETYALRAGDVFTVANVFAVNPMSGESTGALRQFVVTADLAVTDSGSATANAQLVHMEPGMVATGPYKTVDTFPAAASVIKFIKNGAAGTTPKIYPQNLAFHKNAFALVMVPLEVPHGTWGSSVTEDGVSVRVIKDYDVDNDLEVCRMDILYGVKTIYPELACRILGAEQ